jgi:lysophospholipase L1-like esterase
LRRRTATLQVFGPGVTRSADRSVMTPSAIMIGLVLAFGSIIFMMGLGEVGLRIYQRLASGVPIMMNAYTHIYVDGMAPVPFSCVLDDQIGWRPTPNLHFEGEGQSADGGRYRLRVTQDENGFRAFGRLDSGKPKVLFIGDSFTQAVEVSDDQTYYADLGRDLDVEVFGIGARGYSTFQEYLMLDQIVDRIRPDLIVWQACYNDYMANSYDLERSWTASALGIPRPYWEAGRIEHRIPESYAWVIELAGGHSRFLSFLTVKYEHLLFRLDGKKDVLMEAIEARGLQHPGFRRAVDTTREILTMVTHRAQSTPVVVWEACTARDPLHAVLKELAGQTGMHFVDAVPGVLDGPEHSGQGYSIDHIHWNPEGHRIIAQALSGYVRQSGLLAARHAE